MKRKGNNMVITLILSIYICIYMFYFINIWRKEEIKFIIIVFLYNNKIE